jgi:hypothetical protein
MNECMDEKKQKCMREKKQCMQNYNAQNKMNSIRSCTFAMVDKKMEIYPEWEHYKFES